MSNLSGKACKKCGAPRDLPNRAICRKCNTARMRAYPRYMWIRNCIACGAEYSAWSKRQKLCPSCYNLIKEHNSQNVATNNYIYTNKPGQTKHRYMSEEIIGRKLTKNEIIHHLDENPKNNELENLLLLSRSNHGKLHSYLDIQQVIEEKQGNPKSWSEIVKPLSLRWLLDNKIPYLRLSELKAFKDQLLKRPRIASQPDYVQYIMEDRISWYLYPVSFKITAKIPEGLFKANVA